MTNIVSHILRDISVEDHQQHFQQHVKVTEVKDLLIFL